MSLRDDLPLVAEDERRMTRGSIDFAAELAGERPAEFAEGEGHLPAWKNTLERGEL
jgi:hypothetical protein